MYTLNLSTNFHFFSRGIGYPSLWPSSNCRQPLDVSNEFTFKVIDGILSGNAAVLNCYQIIYLVKQQCPKKTKGLLNIEVLITRADQHYLLLFFPELLTFQISAKSSSSNLFTWEAMKLTQVRQFTYILFMVFYYLFLFAPFFL